MEDQHVVDLDADILKDFLFQPPPFIKSTQEDLAILYYEVVERLQIEQQSLSTFGTLERMMIERLATFFVLMRWLESPDNKEEMDARKSKELMSTWDRMFRDYTDHITKSQDIDDIRSNIVAEVVSKTVDVIDRFIADPAAAANIKEALADSLETASL